MDIENQEVIYCADDDEYRVYSEICDELRIERYFKNHIKSKTQTNNVRKTEQFYKSIQIISLI